MNRPHVVVHATVSVDGRLTGFPVNMGLHYELAAAIPHEAVLTSSATLLDGAVRAGVDLSVDDTGTPADDAAGLAGDATAGDGPWLVMVDSGGRVRRLEWLRGQPYWRDVIVACSDATPPGRIDDLRRRGVEHVVVGSGHVDLAALLQQLAARFRVRDVRVDAGGTLTGLLLAAGLVDELSVVVAPYVVGAGGDGRTGLADGLTADPHRLVLVGVERLRLGHTALRYHVAVDPS